MNTVVNISRRHPLFVAAFALASAVLVSQSLMGGSRSLARYQHGKPGSTWALITGASDGIGYGFAEALLQRGFNVVLHGRDKPKLDALVTELTSTYAPLQVRSVIADAACLHADIDGIRKTVDNLPGPLTVLVNNVGGSPRELNFKALHTMTADEVDHLINLNIRFTAQLTRATLPVLLAAQPALVIGVGSIAAHIHVPFQTLYSGGKAFIESFSHALKREAYATGVDLESMTVLVGNTMSGMNEYYVPHFTASSAMIANGALDKVGAGRAVVWARWRHHMQYRVLSWFPDWVRDRMLADAVEKWPRC